VKLTQASKCRLLSNMSALVLVTAFGVLSAQTATGQTASLPEILPAVAERGKELMAALRDYTYYAEISIQTVSQSDTITGKFYRFSQVSFDRDGNRQEKILENTSTLPKDVHIGTNAANNLTRVYHFVITPETLNQYELTYVGRERIDELNTFVFDVKPKIKIPDPDKSSERYLRGRVWIDDQDMCVVKVAGEALPEQSAHRTPKFETYFQNYGKYWFPAYTSADDSIRVGRYFTRVVVNVRFTSYKKASAR
jgi:outer membrane lipoprotein-sorting protein